MGLNHRSFFAKCRQRYGNAYRFRFVDMTLTTFIHDEHFAASTGKSPKLYNMYHAVMPSAMNVFNLKFSMMEEAPVFHKKVAKMFGNHKTLSYLCNHLVDGTNKLLFKTYAARTSATPISCGEEDWASINLYTFMRKVVFIAGVRATLGDYEEETLESDEFFSKWTSFDSMMPFLSIPWVPGWLFFRSTRRDQDFISDFLDSLPSKDQTELFKVLQNCQSDPSCKHKLGKTNIFIIHWAMNANSGPALFWVMLRILRDNNARDEILQEIQSVLRDEQGWDFQTQITTEVTKNLVVLKSYIKDTIRLYSSGWLLRGGVTRDHVVQLSTGEQIQLSKGENIGCHNSHFDEDLFPDAHSVKTSRFRQNSKFKDSSGRTAHLPLMVFGHGAYRCPGEQFATMELVTMVAVFLTSFDFEVVDSSSDETEPDLSRVGFGIMPLDPRYCCDHKSVAARFRPKYHRGDHA